MRRLIVFSLLFASSVALSNDGSGFKAAGGAAGLMKGQHPSVRLVDEKLHITLPSGIVRVEYVFKNEGPATKAVMAFPEEGYMLPKADESRAKKGQSLFGYFKTWVDGKPFTVRRAKAVQNPEAFEFSNYQHWWVKEVPFAKGQTRKIVNEYQGGLGWGPPWTPERSFSYTLRTGGTWKGGTIGRLAVTVDARGLAGKAPLTWYPESGWKRSGDIWTFNRTNYKPTDDIAVRWPDGFYAFDVNGKDVPNTLYGMMPPPPMKVSPVKIGDEVYVPVALVKPILGVSTSPDSGMVRLSHSGSSLLITPKLIGQGKTPMLPLRQIVSTFGGDSWWQNGRLQIRFL